MRDASRKSVKGRIVFARKRDSEQSVNAKKIVNEPSVNEKKNDSEQSANEKKNDSEPNGNEEKHVIEQSVNDKNKNANEQSVNDKTKVDNRISNELIMSEPRNKNEHDVSRPNEIGLRLEHVENKNPVIERLVNVHLGTRAGQDTTETGRKCLVLIRLHSARALRIAYRGLLKVDCGKMSATAVLKSSSVMLLMECQNAPQRCEVC
jgi:hypothetical protein